MNDKIKENLNTDWWFDYQDFYKSVKEIDEYNKRALWTINRYACNEKDDIMVDTPIRF
jgi:hypothetical protein